jgi:hypothetical protein
MFLEKLKFLIQDRGNTGERTTMMNKILSACEKKPFGNSKWLMDERAESDLTSKATNALDPDFLEEYHTQWDMTEQYFGGNSKIQPRFNPKDYRILVQVYISFHIIANQDAEKNFALSKKDRPRETEGKLSTETSRLCLNRIHDMWREAIELGYTGCIADRNQIGEEKNYPDFVEALVMLIFRGFCWSFCHHMVEGLPRVQSEYWESKMPIYIG